MATFTAGFSGNGQYRLRAEVTQGTQSVDNNTTVVNYSLYVDKLSGSGYWTGTSGNSSSLGGDLSGASGIGGWWAPYDFRDYSSLLIASGSKTVTHNADGTKSLSATFGANDSEGGNFGSASGSISMTLTTIPRATTPTFTPNPVEIGQSVTIGLPRASASFTHDVTWQMGVASGTIATGAGTSTSWTPPISLLTQMVTLMSAPVTITVVTKNGGTTIGTRTAALTVTAPDGSPYWTPTIHASAERSLSDGTPDPDGVCLLLHLDAAVASIDTGSEQNDLTYKVEAKPRGTSTWYELDEDTIGALTITDGLVYVEWDTAEDFDTGSSYDVRVTVTDQLGSAAVSVLILSTSEALLDVYKPTRGLAVGQVFDSGLGGSLQLLDEGYQRQGNRILDEDDFADDAAAIAGTADDLAVTPGGLHAALAVPALVGARRSKPASVSTVGGAATIDADGTVRVTTNGVTTLRINGCITPGKSYLVSIFATTAAGAALTMRLRTASTDYSTSDYTNMVHYGSTNWAGTVADSAGGSITTSMTIGVGSAGTLHYATVTLIGRGASSLTSMWMGESITRSGAIGYVTKFGGDCGAGSTHTGITLIPSASSLQSGTEVRIWELG